MSNIGGSTPCPVGYGIDLSNFSITNAAFRSPGFSVDGAGNLTARSTRTQPTTVAGLGSCSSSNDGARWGVTDATATTPGAVLAGSGSNHMPAYCNGTNWIAL